MQATVGKVLSTYLYRLRAVKHLMESICVLINPLIEFFYLRKPSSISVKLEKPDYSISINFLAKMFLGGEQ